MRRDNVMSPCQVQYAHMTLPEPSLLIPYNNVQQRHAESDTSETAKIIISAATSLHQNAAQVMSPFNILLLLMCHFL